MITPEYIKSALEHAPKHGPAHPDNLRGHWLKGDDGQLYYVCAHCAGRMVARGCSLGRGAIPVWKDEPEPFGVCYGCEVASITAAT